MSVRLAVPAPTLRTLAGCAALFVVSLVYLGLAPLVAVLSVLSWLAVGSLGAVVLEPFLKTESIRHRLLTMLGPGPLLGISLAVFVYLALRGGVFGLWGVIALLAVAPSIWLRRAEQFSLESLPSKIPVLSLVGAALLANSREFPNLLLTATGVLIFAIALEDVQHHWFRLAVGIFATSLLFIEVISRPDYWWWSSNDTATLAGIGTMIIERGAIADIAGWSTSSHHWLLHAWLALWNMISGGNILQTYLIAWPLLAAVSLFASLLLCLELFLGKRVPKNLFLLVASCTAGFIQLEWAAPQEQQPFVFAMFACVALWLTRCDRNNPLLGWRLPVAVVVTFIIVPTIFYFLKPSLLVAYALILFGTILVQFGWLKGYRLLAGMAASAIVIVSGIAALSFASSGISRRSFASISISFMSRDLGWCKTESVAYSTLCVLSLQSILLAAATVSALFLLLGRKSSRLVISPLIFVPLGLAYLPLRFFVSSGVGSGSPSFYRLSEMGLMLFVAIVLTLAVEGPSKKALAILLPGAFAIVAASWSPGVAYDAVARLLVRFSLFKYLNASDAIALGLTLSIALLVVAASTRWRKAESFIAVLLSAVCLVPIARTTSASLVGANDPIRKSRPADFGPSDIEDVAIWIRNNTPNETRFATNYLCPTERLAECSSSASSLQCPSREPLLWSSWMLVAFSKRDFVYLSQWWDNKNHFFDHELSTALGKNPTGDSIRELEDADVSYYLASRAHTSKVSWRLFQRVGVFESENFVVVPLAKLREQLTT